MPQVITQGYYQQAEQKAQSLFVQTQCVVLLFLLPELRGAGGGLCVCLTTLSLRAGADKLVEGLTSLGPNEPRLGWRSAPSLPQRVQTCISHSKEQPSKVEAVGQERWSLSSVDVSLCTGGITVFLYFILMTYRIKWTSRNSSMNSKRGMKSTCPVS